MTITLFVMIASAGVAAPPLTSGDHLRSLMIVDQTRSYLLHVPPSYDRRKPTPIVLALHPFATNGPMMARISGLSETADREGFLVAYPNGAGRGAMLHWDVWTMAGENDDVGYIVKVLDDMAAIANVDPKRVYATGFSNGGMMCYRLAAELSDRIAAVAPVAGTMTTAGVNAKRPVSILHFHGTKDNFVSYDGRLWRDPGASRLKGVEESVKYWAKRNDCPRTPVSVVVPREVNDGLVIKRLAYGPGRDGSEVVLYVIEGGGHTWPGRKSIGAFLGETALDLKANDLIWEFFQKHPRR